MTVPAVPSFTTARTGAEILNDVAMFLGRFVAHPTTHALTAHAVWVAHTHVVTCFDNTPRLAFLSPEPGSGKTRALEVTAPLVADPVLAVNVTPAYLFRRIAVDEGQPVPTVLFDEVDAVFGKRPSEQTEEIRGLLNSGYRRGAVVGRAVARGKEIVTEEWPSFAPVALAGLDDLPDTLMTRAVAIRMRRRSPTERVDPYRARVEEPGAFALRDELAAWASSIAPQLLDAWPELPEGIEDRNADIWEPLIAIADAAGGDWPRTVREAAQHFVGAAGERPATLGIRLLADIRRVFSPKGAMRTADLLAALNGIEGAPWGGWNRGAGLDARGLAQKLAKYDIPTNNTVRIPGEGTHKGYTLRHFEDAWARYLPQPTDTTPPRDGFADTHTNINANTERITEL